MEILVEGVFFFIKIWNYKSQAYSKDLFSTQKKGFFHSLKLKQMKEQRIDIYF